MKKQQKTYILLAVVLCIWGVIGYQIYSRMNPSIPELEDVEIQTTFRKQKNVVASYYELKKEYRDPFTGKYPKKKVVKRKKKKPAPKKELLPLPRIVFNGTVENGKKKTYILTINGQQELLKIGDTLQKVILLNVKDTLIKVKFDGRITTISLPE